MMCILLCGRPFHESMMFKVRYPFRFNICDQLDLSRERLLKNRTLVFYTVEVSHNFSFSAESPQSRLSASNGPQVS